MYIHYFYRRDRTPYYTNTAVVVAGFGSYYARFCCTAACTNLRDDTLIHVTFVANRAVGERNRNNVEKIPFGPPRPAPPRPRPIN